MKNLNLLSKMLSVFIAFTISLFRKQQSELPIIQDQRSSYNKKCLFWGEKQT